METFTAIFYWIGFGLGIGFAAGALLSVAIFYIATKPPKEEE